jgi:phage protein D
MAMKPRFRITADNADITDLINPRLLSLSITDEFGLVSDTMTLDLDNRDGALEIPPRGAELAIELGYDELFPMGRFIVDECEIKHPPATMTITGRASDSTFRDMGAFLSPRTESHEKKTVSDIVNAIAGRYGLTASIAAAFGDIMVEHLDQTDESDSAFLMRLAADFGAGVKIANGMLLFIEPLSGMFPDGSPLPTVPITGNDISSYRMRIMERGKYGMVVAKYYDFNAAEVKEVAIGDSSPIFTLRETFRAESIARNRAEIKMREITQGTKTLSLELIGNPLLSAESQIAISIPEIMGDWIIKSATHRLDSGGYKTSIEGVIKP